MVRNGKDRPQDGFTLVELLVVISIITVLISIMAPLVARAREMARDVKCAANLQQLAAAFKSYEINYDGAWPFPASTNANNIDKSKWWHQNFIYAVVYGRAPASSTQLTASWIPGSIFECPATVNLAPPADTLSTDSSIWKSYGMSARLNNLVSDTGDYRGNYKHPNKLDSPSETVLLLDNTQPWAGTVVTSTPAPSNSQLQHLQDATNRHLNGQINVLYCDGHVAALAYAAIPQIHGNAAWELFWGGKR